MPLRHSVLWPNKPLAYVKLPEDDAGEHYGAFIDGIPTPVAVVSVFYETLPQPETASTSEVPPPVVPALRFRKFRSEEHTSELHHSGESRMPSSA